jgi:hypothetical protein
MGPARSCRTHLPCAIHISLYLLPPLLLPIGIANLSQMTTASHACTRRVRMCGTCSGLRCRSSPLDMTALRSLHLAACLSSFVPERISTSWQTRRRCLRCPPYSLVVHAPASRESGSLYVDALNTLVALTGCAAVGPHGRWRSDVSQRRCAAVTEHGAASIRLAHALGGPTGLTQLEANLDGT